MMLIFDVKVRQNKSLVTKKKFTVDAQAELSIVMEQLGTALAELISLRKLSYEAVVEIDYQEDKQ